MRIIATIESALAAAYRKDFGKRYTEYEMDEIGFEGLKKALQKKLFKIKKSK